MDIKEFAEQNNIAIIAKAGVNDTCFEILKRDLELESYDLFNQLILYGTVDGLKENVEGQIMPRIWVQGNTKCVICMPKDKILVALFYDNDMNARDNFFHAEHLDELLRDVFAENADRSSG